MSDADRPGDGDGLSGPERDAMVASLLGITPERLRTIRRVHRKRVGSALSFDRRGLSRWQRLDQLSDDALFATFRQREVRARAVSRTLGGAPADRLPRRSIGLR